MKRKKKHENTRISIEIKKKKCLKINFFSDSGKQRRRRISEYHSHDDVHDDFLYFFYLDDVALTKNAIMTITPERTQI